jgi:hypothetical protein
MNHLVIILLVFVGFIILYLIFRLGSKAILRSYYEEKNRQYFKKGEENHGKKV